MTGAEIRELAAACGFELAGVARAEPAADAALYHAWTAAGYAAEMRYLTDRRGDLRDHPRNLLPGARSIVCVGKLYNTPLPYSTRFSEAGRAWISRYAWGDDYHDTMRRGLQRLEAAIREHSAQQFEARACVDTAPLLERSYARLAGLGWIGKNTCLINQQSGSWYFLGELLLTLDIEADTPPPDRCGTCRRCIDACPTAAIVTLDGRWTVDSRLCISYYTIEARGAASEDLRQQFGAQIFGCDICQDVCPWNRRAPVTEARSFDAAHFAPELERMGLLAESEFREMFRASPVSRARYRGFLRNVAVAMGNSGQPHFRDALERLAGNDDPVVADSAGWALGKLAPAALSVRD